MKKILDTVKSAATYVFTKVVEFIKKCATPGESPLISIVKFVAIAIAAIVFLRISLALAPLVGMICILIFLKKAVMGGIVLTQTVSNIN